MLKKNELIKSLEEIEEKNKEINENIDDEIKNIKNNKEEYDKIELQYNRKEELQWKLENLKKARERKLGNLKYIKILIFIIIFMFFLSFLIENKFSSSGLFIVRTVLAFYCFVFILLYFLKNSTSNMEEIKEVSDELDYLNSENHSEEIKAEKQFRMYQNELQKYYSQNLSHSQNIFYTGIISIIIGFGIIVYTLWYLTYNEAINNSTQLMLTGGIGGILSNFIGVIYLKMYSETLKVLTAFHNKLVYTQNLHFSNCLLAKIKNKELKEKVLEEAILEIVKKETTN